MHVELAACSGEMRNMPRHACILLVQRHFSTTLLPLFTRFLWCLVFKFPDYLYTISISSMVSPAAFRAAVGAVGVLAAVSAGRARGSKASRAARVVAAASKVDTVCILGCAGAVGQDAAVGQPWAWVASYTWCGQARPSYRCQSDDDNRCGVWHQMRWKSKGSHPR